MTSVTGQSVRRHGPSFPDVQWATPGERARFRSVLRVPGAYDAASTR